MCSFRGMMRVARRISLPQNRPFPNYGLVTSVIKNNIAKSKLGAK